MLILWVRYLSDTKLRFYHLLVNSLLKVSSLAIYDTILNQRTRQPCHSLFNNVNNSARFADSKIKMTC